MQLQPPSPHRTAAASTVLPKDNQGIWVLDITWKPVRIIDVEDRGKRRKVHYMYYRVVNHTGKPRSCAAIHPGH